jgi:hypothetical protein
VATANLMIFKVLVGALNASAGGLWLQGGYKLLPCEIGEGHLQEQGKMEDEDVRLERNDATRTWLVLGEGVRIELWSAAEAALRLAEVVQEVPTRFIVRQIEGDAS